MQLGTSRWVPIGLEDVRAFAEATGDRWRTQVSTGEPGSGPLEVPIVQGFFLLTTIARLFPSILQITGRSMSVNYGTEDVRFLAPVPVGSLVRLVGVLAGAEKRPGGSVLTRIHAELELKGSLDPAAVAELLFLVQPDRTTS